MILFDENLERNEEFTNETPKELVDETKSDLEQLENDLLLKRRFDCLALELLNRDFQSGEMSEKDYCQAVRSILFRDDGDV